MIKRRKPLQHKTPLRRKTRLRSISPKKAAAYRLYGFRAKRFKKEHPVCEICERRRTVDVHHCRGRHSPDLLDELTWLAVCRPCHNWIHNHANEARAKGWLR